MALDIRHRFPGLVEGWARFDGPAGTLVVDAVIEAMRAYLASPAVANVGGTFGPSEESSALLHDARALVGKFLGAPSDSVVFGANMTTLTFAFTRSIAAELREGDEIVCTQLDHDANVTPWVMAARDRGAKVVFAALEAETGRLPVTAIEECLTDRTRWVAVTGASNLIGTMPDLAGIVRVAHDAGTRVFVDAVHLAPHRRIDFGSLGCDALVTSPYKWYGPHAGVLVLEPGLLGTLEPYKVRPAPDDGPRRFETGTPALEAIAGVAAAAHFLLDIGIDTLAASERSVFATLLTGLQAIGGVTVHGPADGIDRAPTVLFTVSGVHPDDVAARLGAAHVAVWSGDSYALEAARALGFVDPSRGVGVRAGVVGYCSDDDVQQLLRAVEAIRP